MPTLAQAVFSCAPLTRCSCPLSSVAATHSSHHQSLWAREASLCTHARALLPAQTCPSWAERAPVRPGPAQALLPAD